MQIKNVKVYGLEESLIRSGYPMQTGEPEDLPQDVICIDINTIPTNIIEEDKILDYVENNNLGQKIKADKCIIKDTDKKRAEKLARTPNGSGHNNFLKGIIVQFDLQYPEYFSPQLQRYHWVDIVSSQSKMHKITSRILTKDDFTENTFWLSIVHINDLINRYNSNTEINSDKKLIFNQIISSLPSGYLKWMGISTNYLQLKTIYYQRRHHKLQEWQDFCKFLETLPMSELITGKDE